MANVRGAEVRLEIAELQLELRKHQWLAAVRWRRCMQTCLATAGVTFNEWLVLDAIDSLVDGTRGPAPTDDIERRLELDALTIWHAVAVLEHHGLLTRQASLSGKTRGLQLTREGVTLLREITPRLSGVSMSSS